MTVMPDVVLFAGTVASTQELAALPDSGTITVTTDATLSAAWDTGSGYGDEILLPSPLATIESTGGSLRITTSEAGAEILVVGTFNLGDVPIGPATQAALDEKETPAGAQTKADAAQAAAAAELAGRGRDRLPHELGWLRTLDAKSITAAYDVGDTLANGSYTTEDGASDTDIYANSGWPIVAEESGFRTIEFNDDTGASRGINFTENLPQPFSYVGLVRVTRDTTPTKFLLHRSGESSLTANGVIAAQGGDVFANFGTTLSSTTKLKTGWHVVAVYADGADSCLIIDDEIVEGDAGTGHCDNPFVGRRGAGGQSSSLNVALAAIRSGGSIAEVKEAVRAVQAKYKALLDQGDIVRRESALVSTLPFTLNEEITLTADRTITADITFGPKGKIITDGNVLTINGRVEADPFQQIFEVGAPREVLGSFGQVVRHVGWWGAVPTTNSADAATANWLAIQSAIDCSGVDTSNSVSGALQWATSQTIVAGNTRQAADTNVYRCIADHTSAAADEPAVGVNWETYWRLAFPATPYQTNGISVVQLGPYSYYFDRPLDKRGRWAPIVGQRYHLYPTFRTKLVARESAEWVADDNRRWDDYFGSFTAGIFMGHYMLQRASDSAEATVYNGYNQGLFNIAVDMAAITSTDCAPVYAEGSLEENCEIRNVLLSGGDTYGFGFNRNTITNGFEIAKALVRTDAANSIGIRIGGMKWALRDCSINVFQSGTGGDYAIVCGGRNGLIESCHIEKAQLAGIRVIDKWFGVNGTPGGGAPAVVTISNVNGHILDAAAPVVDVYDQEASVVLTNITRSDAGPIVKDTTRALTTNGTSLNGDAYTIRAVASYIRQADDNVSSNYHISTTDPALVDPRFSSTPQVLTDGSAIVNDTDLGLISTLTLEENSTLAAPTNARAGDSGTIYVTQTGAFTLGESGSTQTVVEGAWGDFTSSDGILQWFTPDGTNFFNKIST